MKHSIMSVIAVALVLSFAGCQYLAPLAEGHTVAVDPAVIGLWKEVPEGDKPPDPDEKMLILKYSDTEYLVHYPIGRTVTTRIYLQAPASLEVSGYKAETFYE
jgi:hypothetical protein